MADSLGMFKTYAILTEIGTCGHLVFNIYGACSDRRTTKSLEITNP
jgi:hypothetical protein